MTTAPHSMHAATVIAALVATLLCGTAGAAEPKATNQKASKSGIPYLTDDQVGPPDLVNAIKARRSGGKLLNLDRILLHSPNFTKGWNTMFGAIRNQLSLPGKLRELAIMQIGVLNKAEYESRKRLRPRWVRASSRHTPSPIARRRSPPLLRSIVRCYWKDKQSRRERGNETGGRHEVRETVRRIGRVLTAARQRRVRGTRGARETRRCGNRPEVARRCEAGPQGRAESRPQAAHGARRDSGLAAARITTRTAEAHHAARIAGALAPGPSRW